jgi:hypothetical protein
MIYNVLDYNGDILATFEASGHKTKMAFNTSVSIFYNDNDVVVAIVPTEYTVVVV